ncbi:MAG: T9SS type A sorting domain-containing protein, partial [Bacteroidetes bacterium]|nr:T9SS type A sorting domain-containing protein [Bacteroidota bacterium]
QNNPSSIDFIVHIFNNGKFFWSESFTVDIVTGIAENETNLPIEYTLKQNYPNPFNPSTRIKYSIPQSSNVVIKVFDILGNEIETLVNEQMSVGTYEITWYAGQLPSGVYFYQLKAGSYIETKKMILLR